MTIHNRPPKFRRILARKLARRVRALDRALLPQDAIMVRLQIRSLRDRLNKVA